MNAAPQESASFFPSSGLITLGKIKRKLYLMKTLFKLLSCNFHVSMKRQKSTMFLNQSQPAFILKRVNIIFVGFIWVCGEFLHQVKKFKYPGDLFATEG